MITDVISPKINNTFSLKDVKACLFDFDGVIVDSEKLHTRIKQQTLDQLGINYPKDVAINFQGRPDIDFFNYVNDELLGVQKGLQNLSVQKMLSLKHDLYRENNAKLTLVDGIKEMLRYSKNKVGQTVIVTSSTINDVKNVTEKHFPIETFDFIVSFEDTKRHKPFPDPYEKAVFLCDLKPEECLVIEDTPNGVLAARAAGCRVAAITKTFSRRLLAEANADVVFDQYKQLLDLINAGKLFNL